MTSQKIETGLVIFWTTSEFSSHNKLKAGLDAAGWGDYCPSPMENVTALKHALGEVFPGSRHLVRPLANRGGFNVKREERGEDENDILNVMTAKVAEDGLVITGDQQVGTRVLEAYGRYQGRVFSNQVSQALVKILHAMGGISLRPNGSIYWLHGSKESEWHAICRAMEKAAENGRAVGYTIAHNLDANAITAVHDAIIHEVNTEAKRLSEIILGGEVGERAIKARKAEAGELKKKVEQYEQILGVGLAHLKKTLDDVEQTNAVAAMLVSAYQPNDAQQEGVCDAATTCV